MFVAVLVVRECEIHFLQYFLAQILIFSKKFREIKAFSKLGEWQWETSTANSSNALGNMYSFSNNGCAYFIMREFEIELL